MKIRPLHDNLVVRRIEAETTTPGGIVIPDNATEKPQQGEVIAVGAGKKLDDGSMRTPDLKVGDRVVFGQYAGNTIKMGGEELLIMSETDVYGVIE